MKESLAKISDVVAWYKKTAHPSPSALVEALRVVTAHLHTLEEERAKYKVKYEQIIYEGTKNGESVARSQNEAEVKVPELYMLRRVMEASYRIADAIRSQLSFLKSEMNHLNTNQ